jgi:hypothetical protein
VLVDWRIIVSWPDANSAESWEIGFSLGLIQYVDDFSEIIYERLSVAQYNKSSRSFGCQAPVSAARRTYFRVPGTYFSGSLDLLAIQAMRRQTLGFGGERR